VGLTADDDDNDDDDDGDDIVCLQSATKRNLPDISIITNVF
jgi:hypothetical protein